jgi:hypothetical protein
MTKVMIVCWNPIIRLARLVIGPKVMAYSSHGSRRQTEKRKKETAEEEVGVQRQERGTGVDDINLRLA